MSYSLNFLYDDATKIKGLKEMFETAVQRRGIALKTFAWDEQEPTLGGKLKWGAKIQDGLEQEKAKAMVKAIKDSKMKVQASIQGDELRITGKQIDDLQAVMALLDAGGFGVPLQYVNMKK